MAYRFSQQTAAPDTRTVALYVRVSTGYQVDKDSLPFQKQELRNYCRHVLHIEESRLEVFEDAGKSGKNTKRPAFERMMTKVKAGLVSHVIVYKIDRISRNLVDFSLMYDDFKYNRVTFISLNEQFDTSSAIGEAVLKIILIFAELERKLTSERVTDIMINRALSGQWNGARMPFGWDWDEEKKMPLHSDKEAPTVRLMYDMYEETRSSCRVRDYFNSHDIATKRGGEWTTKTIADLIRNPMNKGDYRYNYRESAKGRRKPDEEVVYVKNVFPPLVPPDQWDRCNQIMDHNAKLRCSSGFPHKGTHIHIFAGLLKCGKCGSYFQVEKRDRVRRNGFAPSLYRCGRRYRKQHCISKSCSEVVVGPFVLNYISAMIRASDMRSQIHSPEELEKILLSDSVFQNVAGIVSDGLNATYAMLSGTDSSVPYRPLPLASHNVQEDDNVQKWEQGIVRIDRAIERLKKVYLFDDAAMSEKEYLETKSELERERIELDNKIKEQESATFPVQTEDLAFIKSASSFLLAHRLKAGDHIQYNTFAPLVDDEVLKDFLNLVIKEIVVVDARITEITFQNGLTHKFLYRE